MASNSDTRGEVLGCLPHLSRADPLFEGQTAGLQSYADVKLGMLPQVLFDYRQDFRALLPAATTLARLPEAVCGRARRE